MLPLSHSLFTDPENKLDLDYPDIYRNQAMLPIIKLDQPLLAMEGRKIVPETMASSGNQFAWSMPILRKGASLPTVPQGNMRMMELRKPQSAKLPIISAGHIPAELVKSKDCTKQKFMYWTKGKLKESSKCMQKMVTPDEEQASASVSFIISPLRRRTKRIVNGVDQKPQFTTKCRLCGNDICCKRVTNLLNHARRHSSWKQYQCPHCPYAHTELAKVRIHATNNHPHECGVPIDRKNEAMKLSWNVLMKQCFPDYCK